MNDISLPRIFVGLPVINENEMLPGLIDCLRQQSYKNFNVFICINQPDEWWNLPEKRPVCENNLQALAYLRGIRDLSITLLDRCSPGNGWKGKRHGVGWARKTVMEAINREAGERDVIVSMDADTTFGKDYLLSVAENFSSHPAAVALAVPYFHKPVSDPSAYRAVLHYEIYMRYYAINLWRTGTPYTFAALGSAMACFVGAFRAVGGLTPKMSGEDFYFLQKLRKYGTMLFWNREKVYPAARFSDRVYFGTGPAMIKGNEGDWSSYPIYPYSFFDEIRDTIGLFPSFFISTKRTRVVDFLSQQFREEDPFRSLRENFSTPELFIRACHEKFDGLRILQYLKSRFREEPATDEDSLFDFLDEFSIRDKLEEPSVDRNCFSFQGSSLQDLEKIRMYLAKKEEICQISQPPF